MSSAGGKKDLAEETEEVVSNDLQNVVQNAKEAESDAFRRITRSMAKAKGKIPTNQKIFQGQRMIVLVLPAPSQAKFYEQKTHGASKQRKMAEGGGCYADRQSITQ